jgi:cysteine desulfurase
MSDQTPPVYLDAAVSTPPREEAVRAAAETAARFADPTSTHAFARSARAALEEARGAVARALGAQTDEVVFTSGGTEANVLATLGTSMARSAVGARFVTTGLEHGSILNAARAAGLEPVEVPCDASGRVDVDRWADLVATPGVVMASIQHASHLVGSIQPVAECIRLARPYRVPVLVDACQTLATVPIDVGALGADLLSVSGHKAYGPPGVGALYVRRGTPIAPLFAGDARERRMRAGMPNLPGLAGMAAAIEAANGELPDRAARLWSFTERLRSGLVDAGIVVLGHPTQRVPHIVTWSAPGVDAEALLMTLEDRGILTSTVATAPLIGAGLARPGDVIVRFGLWPGITAADVDHALGVVPAVVRDLTAIEYGPLGRNA